MNNEKKFIKLTPFKMQVLQSFPFIDEDFDAITNYELLCKVVEYLNKTVDNVNLLESDFKILYDYVHDYFDNLDVQEEINNKLDEMAESGELTDIIAQYLGLAGVLSFNTVADMKQATNLVNGSTAKTLGYNTINDGGGALYKIRNITNEDVVNDMDIISLNNPNLISEIVVNEKINIKQFGAKGDSIHDDTQNIQRAVNYAFENNLKVNINGSNNYYLITMPIILDITRGANGYWQGKGSIIYGENKDTCRIVKIGNSVYTNHSNPNVNNINATFISANTNESLEKGTGIVIDNVSLENYSDTSFNKTSDSLGLWTNVPRSTYKNLNITAYKGIDANCFSCLFENIVYNCIEKALELSSGTSNLFRFMYAPGCTNPYKIISSYSTLMNVCCDNGRGTLFNLGGMGLSLIDCGCESVNAQNIFKINNNYTTLSIKNFYMHRQIGDSENNINLEDCAVLYSQYQCVVDIDNFSVIEFNKLDTDNHNSYFFKPEGNGATAIATSLKNLRYYKNYQGEKNKRMLLWYSYPSRQCQQRYSTPTAQFNYSVTDDLNIYPFIGGYYGDNLPYESMGGSINESNISSTKTLWLDCKTKYTTSKDSNIRYTAQHHKGDIQFYNDPLLMNALGLAITNEINTYTWDAIEIPIVLRGTTEERPTQNLYIGLMYFDTTLNKPIWRKSNGWVDSTGNTV